MRGSQPTRSAALIDMPLVRRQLMKLMVPTEQALSVFTYDGDDDGPGAIAPMRARSA